MVNYLFFDLDGTLTDSSEGVCKSFAFALNRLGVRTDNLESLKKYLGPPLSVGFADFFEGEKIKEAETAYRERYRDVGWKENRVYDGMPEALERLRRAGYKIVMATSKPEPYARQIAEYFDFAKYFDYICGATFDGRISSKAEVIRYALDTTGANPEEVCMIGDRFYDVEGAAAFGIGTLGVTFGFGTREELLGAGAFDTVGTPAEIADYFEPRR